MKIKLALGSLPLVSLLVPASTYADNSCGTETVIIHCSGGNGDGVTALLVTIVNFLAVGVGLAVVAGIIYGGFLYASAGGSAEQAKRGIGFVRNAVIALVVFIFMYAIINFLVPGGLF